VRRRPFFNRPGLRYVRRRGLSVRSFALVIFLIVMVYAVILAGLLTFGI